MKLRIVPSRDGFMEQYAEWCHVRQLPVQAHFLRASAHIWVEAEGHGLILGLGLYESPGFVMAEEMVSKPGCPAHLVHKAVSLAAGAMVSHCALVCKYPVLHTTSRGLMRLLVRKGFHVTGYATLTRMPFHQVAIVDPLPKKPEPAPAKSSKRAPARRPRKGPRRKG